ncbi:FAD-binding oxidoreductase [Janibacter sp. Y6]|uniref:NAD(P)/FAD-dependent oxidoreductase n=1 Tax=Janibacter sp. Y6 TaxID=2913552 RepID=UPI0034A3A7AE
MVHPLWWDDAAPSPAPPELPAHADVAVVGGGYTGLWTVYHLLREQPGIEVVVLEAEHVGFGASGRNGGWVSALFPVSGDALAARHGAPAAHAMLAALRESVEEIGRTTADEGVDAGYVRGGTLVLARGRAQEARARSEVAADARWGGGTRWLDRDEALERLAAADRPGRTVLGATASPHCARVHPRRLADGLAAAVRRRGGVVVEQARVADVVREGRTHRLLLDDGRELSAGTVVRATEAWTATLPRLRRRLAPVYSLMVATAPLTAQQWDEVGLADREVFADHGHLVVYGQRTVDDRIAFGGRGAPYHYGSRIRPSFDHDDAVFAALRTTLRQLLPQVELDFTHAWGGPLAIPRDWHPSVGYDRAARVGWAGGYVGDGVATSHLAGRTLAELVTGATTSRTELPWVGHRSPDWEPEPLRWLGVNAGLRAAVLADHEERRTGSPARIAPVLDRLTGH